MNLFEQCKLLLLKDKSTSEQKFINELFRDSKDYVDLPILIREYANIIHDYAIGATVYYSEKEDNFKKWKLWGSLKHKGYPPIFSLDRRYKIEIQDEN